MRTANLSNASAWLVRSAALALAWCSISPPQVLAESAAAYDPLFLERPVAGEPLDLAIADEVRKREIPIRIFLPASAPSAAGTDAGAPLVLFSHGLGGSRTNSAYLGKHWAARGYAVVYLQHAGSDEHIWKDLPAGERLEAMRAAASLKNALLRLQDVRLVLDQLAAWTAAPDHVLARKLDVGRVGMSGHSFGAVTTQGVSGERFPLFGKRHTDKRIQAAVLLSPSNPRGDEAAAERAFGSVDMPWLVMTGTKDNAVIGHADAESRRWVYAHLPPGGKYELVLHNAEHSAFSDRPLPGDKEPRNPNHHKAVLALSTAFWDAYLRHDSAARAWLDGDGPKNVLDAADAWQRK